MGPVGAEDRKLALKTVQSHDAVQDALWNVVFALISEVYWLLENCQTCSLNDDELGERSVGIPFQLAARRLLVVFCKLSFSVME